MAVVLLLILAVVYRWRKRRHWPTPPTDPQPVLLPMAPYSAQYLDISPTFSLASCATPEVKSPPVVPSIVYATGAGTSDSALCETDMDRAGRLAAMYSVPHERSRAASVSVRSASANMAASGQHGSRGRAWGCML